MEHAKVYFVGLMAIIVTGYLLWPERTAPRVEQGVDRGLDSIVHVIERNPDLFAILVFVFIILFLGTLLIKASK